MNQDRDLDRLLDTWFADGPVMAPDRVVDGVASRIPRQRQLPAWRLRSWRFPSMSTPLKLVAIGAALLAVLVGGAVFMGAGSAPPAPTTAPTPTLAPTPSPMAIHSGPLEPGTYTGVAIPGDPMTWTVTVPAGWSGYDTWAVLSPETDGHGIVVGIEPFMTVPEDSCAAAGTRPPESVDDVLAAVEARDDWVVSDPQPTAIGEFSGSRVDVELPADVDVCDGENYMVLVDETGDGFPAQGPSNLFTFSIVDVDGRPVTIFRAAVATIPAAHMAESDQIVDSIVITP